MIERKIDLIVKNITPISFCGREIMKEVELNGVYELPFEVEPIPGEHNYRKCENCQKELKELTTILNDKFSGKEPNKGFPFCCPKHSNLTKYPRFNRNDFTNVPEMAARKIIYTKQHIINSCALESWYKDITDYIDWVIESFGQMPADCGNPLFLDDYFRFIIHLIKNNIDVPDEKKSKILEYLNLLFDPEKSPKTDLNILVSTYEKWLKIFPFELGYFSKLKPHFEKQLPILNGKPETNKYTGIAKAKMHTKSSLIDTLINLTNELLIQVNGLTLHEKGLLTDPQKTKLELIVSERKLKLKLGYINKSRDEEKRYRQVLKEWFKDEKKFIDEITPIIKALPPQNINTQTPPKKYQAKHHVLAYLFECNAKGESLPIGNKKELERIGSKRIGAGKGNRFYKVFNEVISFDINVKKNLIEIGGEDWRNAVIDLSEAPKLVEEYLQKKQL